MNSAGVPTQGIVVAEATTAKKRGDRGPLGRCKVDHDHVADEGNCRRGTEGSRLKHEWRVTYDDLGPKERRPSLREWARKMLQHGHPDVKRWLDTKRTGLTPEAAKLRSSKRKAQSQIRAEREAKASSSINLPKAKKKGQSDGREERR